MKSLIVLLLAITVISCSNSNSGSGPAPLNTAQKTIVGEEMQSFSTLTNTLDDAEMSNDKSKKGSSDLLNLLKGACTVENSSTGDEYKGTSTTALAGALCPVNYKNVSAWTAHDENGSTVFDTITNDKYYATANKAVLAIVDILSLHIRSAIGEGTDVISQQFEFESLVNGKVTGRQFVTFAPAGGKLVQVTVGIDVNFTDFQVVARANAIVDYTDEENPTLKSANFVVNGQEVSFEDFKNLFPGLVDEEELINQVKAQL